MSESLPPFAVVVGHPVADFDSWKVGFDEHEEARRAAGIVGHHINRAEDDPNYITIYLAGTDLEAMRAFSASDDLKEVMEKVGVTGPPEITWMKPARDAAIRDRQLPAFLLTHHVADFDKWLEGYDAADELRRSHGIIGHAANQSLDDPSLAIVYHQAESFDDLRGFIRSDELREVMKNAGVTSDPEIEFHTGGWSKNYT